MTPINIHTLPQQLSSLPLKLFLLNNLGTTTEADCRKLLREKLFQYLEEAGQSPTSDLLDLDKLPDHQSLNISLSHGSQHSLMGWIPKPYRLGIDIEVLDRLSDKIINRVSNSAEIARAPHPSYLWSAKEAAFKALFPTFNVISSVEIVDWVPVTPQCWTFGVELKNHSVGYGELSLIERHSIAFFTLPS